MSTVNTNANTKPNKATVLVQVQALVAGTEKHFPNGTFTFGGTTYTAATLIQALQGLVQALAAVSTAQATARDAVATLHTVQANVAPLLRDYRRFIRSTFGSATQPLADFGLQPPKARKPLATEKRAAATAKLRATRAARGTTSKKQKLAIKGNVTGVVVTPVTVPNPASPEAPTATATTTASAPSAPAAPSPASTGSGPQAALAGAAATGAAVPR